MFRRFCLLSFCCCLGLLAVAQPQPDIEPFNTPISASATVMAPQYEDDFGSAPLDTARLDSIRLKYRNPYKFNTTQIIAPAALIAVGVIGLSSDWAKKRNLDVKNEFNYYVKDKFVIDDYIQYVPAASVYILNLCGVKGRHNFLERTIIMASAYAMMAGTVNISKHLINEERPDGSSCNSFPSGHTATAFVGATCLWIEYRDVSP